MPGGQLLDRCPRDQAIQRGHHDRAFTGGMLRRTVQGLGQEQLRTLRSGNYRVQLINLLTNGLAP
jgi:hypothetical protein